MRRRGPAAAAPACADLAAFRAQDSEDHIRPDLSGGMGVMVNGAHGTACNMGAYWHTADGRTELRLGLEQEMPSVNVGV